MELADEGPTWDRVGRLGFRRGRTPQDDGRSGSRSGGESAYFYLIFCGMTARLSGISCKIPKYDKSTGKFWDKERKRRKGRRSSSGLSVAYSQSHQNVRGKRKLRE